MGIRRQIKVDSRSISFTRLLGEIADDPSRISRSYYRKLYEGSTVEDLADRHFDRFCDEVGGGHISAKMVQSDFALLKAISRSCEGFADKRIAHRDKRDPKVLPRFNEVDTTVDALDKLYVKYHLIFRAQSMDSVMPTYQYDWQQIFDYPWRIDSKDEIGAQLGR